MTTSPCEEAGSAAYQLSTGAYVLSGNYLYTTEAVAEFLEHLTPGGFVCVVVADLTGGGDFGFPRHSFRQLTLFVDALRQQVGTGRFESVAERTP